MTPEERISLLGDEWAMMRSGHGAVGDYLDLVGAVKNDPSDIVIGAAVGKIATIEARVATDAERDELQAWVRREFAPAYKALGPATEAEAQDKHQMRALLFGVLGAANDPTVLAESKADYREVSG